MAYPTVGGGLGRDSRAMHKLDEGEGKKRIQASQRE